MKQLACRFYKINPKIADEVKELLLNSKKGKPLHFDTYTAPDRDLDLSIVIKDRHKNSYGTEVYFTVDEIIKLQDRENPHQVIRYFKEYQVQVVHDKTPFSDCAIVFGPKVIDRSLVNAIKNYIGKSGKKKVLDPFILIRVDFKTNIEVLTKEFPNLQHFCIKDIPDERMKGVVVRGNSLEETDLFERFVIDEETSGPINFLGISPEFGKLVYLGTDGSVYSRMNFAREDTIKMIYDLYARLKRINALIKPLDDF